MTDREPSAPPTSNLFAAVTGDIVRSSRYDGADLERLHQALRSAATDLGQTFADHLFGAVQLYRGDGVQFLVTDPAQGLRLALFFLAALKAASVTHPFDLRLSIGIGPVSRFPDPDGTGGDGPAYQLSGRGLDRMRTQDRFSLHLARNGEPEALERVLDTQCGLIGALAAGWTVRQAEILCHALLGKTQEEIAGSLQPPISRQAVAKSLAASGWTALESCLRVFEDLPWGRSAG